MEMQIAVLQGMARELVGREQELAASFYQHLFTTYPEVIPLFASADMTRQHTVFMLALLKVVDNLTDSAALLRILQELGERHASYQVEGRHYPMVRRALLETLAQFFAGEWTEERRTAWADAYDTIAEQMQRGAARVQAS